MKMRWQVDREEPIEGNPLVWGTLSLTANDVEASVTLSREPSGREIARVDLSAANPKASCASRFRVQVSSRAPG